MLSFALFRQLRQFNQINQFNQPYKVTNGRQLSTILDKEKIFDKIDGLIDSSKTTKNTDTGSIEYIFVKPAWTKIFDKNIALNPYGHSCVRYSYTTNHENNTIDENNTNINKVMNIVGLKNHNLVNFINPTNYMFSGKDIGNEQGGILNRSFISIRIDNVDANKVIALNDFYEKLDRDNKQGLIKYGTIFYTITNWFRTFMGLPIKGNCSYWTSKGLTHVDIITMVSSWPLLLFFRVLFTQITKTDLQNINIIAYKSIKHKEEPKGAFMYPLYWFKNNYSDIWNLDSIANIIVKPISINEQNDIHENNYKVEVYRHNNKKYQEIVNKWLDIRNKLKRIVRF